MAKKIKNKKKVGFSLNCLDLTKNRIKLIQSTQLISNLVQKANKKSETVEMMESINSLNRVILDRRS